MCVDMLTIDSIASSAGHLLNEISLTGKKAKTFFVQSFPPSERLQ